MSTTSTPILDRVAELYRQGLYLQALDASKELGPLEEWREPSARIMAGRLANNLGAPRLGRVLHRLAFREAPDNLEVIFFHALTLTAYRHPLASLELLDRHPIMEEDSAPLDLRAEWLALRGRTFALLRDFEAAESCIEAALKLLPDNAWIWVERTAIYECEDRHEEGVEAARRAMELRPWFRPAVQALAYRLVQLNRDDEAMNVLEEAAERLESADVLAQLAALYHERQRYADARELYLQIPQFNPLMHRSKTREKWLAAQLADAAYFCGDRDEAIRQAKAADNPYFTRIAERLEDETLEEKRVQLPVKFVQQHHLTCAPATLAAISEFWSRPAMHLEVSEEICYDGTPAHSERRWAEENGFAVREFRVTWDAAKALIDRGIPFTLTTVDPGNAHLQAIVGYDNVRGALLIQDPGVRHCGEAAADKMLEHYDSSGPRGMALVPKEQVELYDGIELQEQQLYDLYYQVEIALSKHHRQQAEQWFAKMSEVDDDHRLTWRARGNLATYDADWSRLLDCTEALLKKYPDDVNLQLAKLTCLGDLGRRADRLAWLKQQTAKPDCNPLFWVRYAQELSEDAREHDYAVVLLRRALRYMPQDGRSIFLLASIAWDAEELEKSARLNRFAACLDDMNEMPARTYFQSLRYLGKVDEAIHFLEDRYRRAGDKSSLPARTLCWAYDQVERMEDSHRVVRETLLVHPEDGAFLLYAAGALGRYGALEEAQGLLARAESISRRIDWLAQSAALALYSGDLQRSLECWQQVVEAEPLNYAAHETIAGLLHDLHDRETAVSHLRQAVERFPHCNPLITMLIEWLRDDRAESEKTLLRYLEMQPDNPWARRELGLVFFFQSRHDEALEQLRLAEELEPSHALVPFLRGEIAETHGDIETARQYYRTTLTLSVDFESAMTALMDTCDRLEDRKRELTFIHSELQRQVTFGDGLLTYRAVAQATLTPEQLLEELLEAHRNRPDLWHAWSATIHQLIEMERFDDAFEWAQSATLKFPLLPRMHMDLAEACGRRKDREGQIAALQKAWQISPSWSEPPRLLADAYENLGEVEQAKETLQRAIACEPKESRNYGYLARVLWNANDREEAINCLERAVNLQPHYQWAWDTLAEWCRELEQHDRVLELARELTRKRPDRVAHWFLLAEQLDAPEHAQEAYAALQKVVAINPRHTEAYSLWAFYLTRDGQFDEALAVCRPQAFGNEPPLVLQGRAAWVEASRGEIETAIEQMLEVTKQDPEYFWAWQQLCEWTNESPEHSELYSQAAHQLARTAPQYAPAWGYLADIALNNEDVDTARKHLLRSIEVAPDYLFGARTLLEIQLRDQDVDGARNTLALTGPYMAPDKALSFATRTDILAGEQQAAVARFVELARTPSESYQALDDVGRAFWDAGWAELAASTLEPLLDTEGTQPSAGYVWVNLNATLENWTTCSQRLNALAVDAPAWAAAAAKFVTEGVSEGQEPLMRAYVARHSQFLRNNDETWYAVAEALNSAEDYQGVVDWLQDWPRHHEAEEWWQVLLVLAHWNLKQPEAAIPIVQHVLAQPPTHATATVQLWGAAYHLFHGELEEAVAGLQAVSPDHLPAFFAECWVLFMRMAQGTTMPYSAAVKAVDAHFEECDPRIQEDTLLQRLVRFYPERLANLQGRVVTGMYLRLKRFFAK